MIAIPKFSILEMTIKEINGKIEEFLKESGIYKGSRFGDGLFGNRREINLKFFTDIGKILEHGSF